MKGALFTAACLAVLAVVLSSHCQHNDPSNCNINCTDSSMEVGCEHDICTCVMASMHCQDVSDCSNMACDKHDEHSHCLDGACKCLKMH